MFALLIILPVFHDFCKLSSSSPITLFAQWHIQNAPRGSFHVLNAVTHGIQDSATRSKERGEQKKTCKMCGQLISSHVASTFYFIRGGPWYIAHLNNFDVKHTLHLKRNHVRFFIWFYWIKSRAQWESHEEVCDDSRVFCGISTLKF